MEHYKIPKLLRTNNTKTIASKSFEYETKLIGTTSDENNT